eukprot:scaffold221628_cov14-Prasinocladus_malaysianus.AAC.1
MQNKSSAFFTATSHHAAQRKNQHQPCRKERRVHMSISKVVPTCDEKIDLVEHSYHHACVFPRRAALHLAPAFPAASR